MLQAEPWSQARTQGTGHAMPSQKVLGNIWPLFPLSSRKEGLEMGPAWPEMTLVNGRTGSETGSSLASASDLYTTASPIRGPADSGLRLARPKVPEGTVVWAIRGADGKMGLC